MTFAHCAALRLDFFEPLYYYTLLILQGQLKKCAYHGHHHCTASSQYQFTAKRQPHEKITMPHVFITASSPRPVSRLI
jgi:hypothetical protein